jgi:hypothetical protein
MRIQNFMFGVFSIICQTLIGLTVFGSDPVRFGLAAVAVGLLMIAYDPAPGWRGT